MTYGQDHHNSRYSPPPAAPGGRQQQVLQLLKKRPMTKYGLLRALGYSGTSIYSWSIKTALTALQRTGLVVEAGKSPRGAILFALATRGG